MVSDEYIRMSREAKELQETWEPKDGDRIIYNDENFDFEYVSGTIYIKCFDLDYYVLIN